MKVSKKPKTKVNNETQDVMDVSLMHAMPTAVLQSIIRLMEELPAKVSRGMLNEFDILQQRQSILPMDLYLNKLDTSKKEKPTEDK